MQMRMYSNPVQTLNFKSVDRIILKIVNPSAYNNYHLRQCLCKASLNKNNFSSCILSTINTVAALAHLRYANKNTTSLYRYIRPLYISLDCYFFGFSHRFIKMFYVPQRAIIAFLAFGGTMISYILRVNLNIAIVTMTDNNEQLCQNVTDTDR